MSATAMKGTKDFLKRDPKPGVTLCSLIAGKRLPNAMIRETKQAIAMARKFNEEVVEPRALELDLKKMEDPDYLPWDLVEEANRRGFFTHFEPKIFGGKGVNLPAMSYFCEELASKCVGIANVVAVHYLGVATLVATWNIRLINELMRDAAEGERLGEPRIMSMAITEPAVGTDVCETKLLNKSDAAFRIDKVDGGYLVNGMKHFISNGHFSKWQIVFGYEDLSKPAESVVILAIKSGTKGFSLGRQERKMGQKACPASELLFDDCFVPDEYVCYSPDQARKLRCPLIESNQQLVDYLSTASRPGVASFATGVARGAYEVALEFARDTEVGGKQLIDHEWAQMQLAEMYTNVVMARLTYQEGNYANGLYGMFKMLQAKPIFYATKYTPKPILDIFMSPILNMPLSTWMFRTLNYDLWKKEHQCIADGYTSIAKVGATDLGLKNCQLALQLMGQAGLRHDCKAEKHLRDSKLLQIYEGPNEINKLIIFKSMISNLVPNTTMFDE
jgi:alkylation response protein AidB-like acyl-CoA dehydrogenase